MTTTHFSEYVEQHSSPQTIFVLGGGPSLKKHDLTPLNTPEHFVICCNQAFQLIPSAKITHHSDYAWWEQYQSRLASEFRGDFITGCGLGNSKTYPKAVTELKITPPAQWEQLFSSTMQVYGNNCGLQAMCIAHLFQPQNIVLIGFDFKTENGQSHGYATENSASIKRYESFWRMFLRDFADFEKIKTKQWKKVFTDRPLPSIWNINPDSALSIYDRSKNLSDFL